MAKRTSARTRLEIEYLSPSALHPDERNARKHTKKQIIKLRGTMREFGFNNPILVDDDLRIIAGHARQEAAIAEKLSLVPCIRLLGLSEASKIALAIADNRLGDLSFFDDDQLGVLFRQLESFEFDTELTGFDTGEIDRILLPVLGGADAADAPVSIDENVVTVTRAGDLWLMGEHRLFCGSALDASAYENLLGEDRAEYVFTDPPYNVPIQGHVSGLGKNRHREFAAASGEMTPAEFTRFLAGAMELMARFSVDGSLHAICMDWRHMVEIQEAGAQTYSGLHALCVWDKQFGGMGSLYRSQHELVFLFKNGMASHINNVNLGVHGRNRSNVWSYPGLAGFGKGRAEALAAHPTVKPVALVADAIRDCSRRNGLVLDSFAGSGTTIIAAERTRRRAAAIEIDPVYVDVAIRRWEAFSGNAATLAGTGLSFATIAAERTVDAALRP